MGKQANAEVKSFALKLDGPPDDEGYFTGAAAVFGNVDQGNDVIDLGATVKSLTENPAVPILYQHDVMEPIGLSPTMEEVAVKGRDGSTGKLAVSGQLTLEVQRARETHALMKAGVIRGLSIGYRPIKWIWDKVDGKSVRRLKEIQILEWSPVVFPMNQLAQVDMVKAQKWLGQYGATESVDCVLSAIGTLTDYLASEVAEGDTDDVARLETVLPILAECLASEISDVAEGESDDGSEVVDVEVYVEMMSEPVNLAVKKLQALLEREPASATRQLKRAATEDATEPDVSTLRALVADIRSAA